MAAAATNVCAKVVNDGSSGKAGAMVVYHVEHEGTHLFDLPQEIQDMIFDYAYPATGRVNIKTCTEWKDEDTDYLDSLMPTLPNRPSRPYPGHKVDEFLIGSKQFFRAAGTAWVRNQHFCVDQVHNTMRSVCDSKSILKPHVTSMTVSGGAPGALFFFFPSLKRVEFTVSVRYFKAVAPKRVWETYLDESDFEKLELFQKLSQARGLIELKLVPSDEYMFPNGFPEILCTNISKMEAMLKQHVTQPKPSSTDRTLSPKWQDVSSETDAEDMDSEDSMNNDPYKAMVDLIKSYRGWDESKVRFNAAAITDSDDDILRALLKDPKGFLAWTKQMKQLSDAQEAKIA